MDNNVDLLIIGAGPAGLAAACEARACGLDVTLVDEQECPGGQIFRNIENSSASVSSDEQEYATGISLVEKFRNCGAKYYPGTTVWGMEQNKIYCTINGKAESLSATNMLVACGGMERPVPFPGWTLPGVMGAGAGDILLKNLGKLAKDVSEVVLAGNGPLILLVAGHLLDAGIGISAILDTGRWAERFGAIKYVPAAFRDFPYFRKGFKMFTRIMKARIPIIRNVENIRAIGTTHISKVQFAVRGKKHEIPTSCLLRHEGVIPRTHILDSMGVALVWDEIQRYWHPQSNIFGQTSIPGIYVAGDAAYVNGGDASILKGRLAGIDVAKRLKVITASEAEYRSREDLENLNIVLSARKLLKHVFAPSPHIFDIPDETIVCRCENVTAGKVRQAIDEQFKDVNEVKRVTRCGMGNCQGRMCGSALIELAMQSGNSAPANVGRLKGQQPFRPVSLENYCALHAPK